jgi:3-hydroxybutyryl-CoA dehydrogenase
MGAGIAQVAAVNGYDVVPRDLKDEPVEQGLETIEGSLSRFAAKHQLSEDEVQAALDRIEPTTELSDFTDADVVVEAIVEDEDAKTSVFKDLDRITPDEAILASNTSSIPITRLGAPTERADQVIGMHFFNPVPLM